MRIHRFYTEQKLDCGQSITLAKPVAHHCIQVLRYQVGDLLVVFNGDGRDYLARIETIDGKKAVASIESANKPDNESPLSIHLYQSVAKGDKMDLLIQKCVELGVSSITPVFSERSNVKLEPKRLEKKLLHWQAVAISACEQSGRTLVPKVNSAIELKALNQLEETTVIYLEPSAEQSFAGLTQTNAIALFIGPEGGFSDQDLKHLIKLGAIGVSLGPRILRTETAGLATIAILQSHFGDL